MSEENKAQDLVRVIVQMAFEENLQRQKLDFFHVKQHYHTMVDRLGEIAFKHGADSAEWRAEVDAVAPRLRDEALARQMATAAAETFNLWSRRPPHASKQSV